VVSEVVSPSNPYPVRVIDTQTPPNTTFSPKKESALSDISTDENKKGNKESLKIGGGVVSEGNMIDVTHTVSKFQPNTTSETPPPPPKTQSKMLSKGDKVVVADPTDRLYYGATGVIDKVIFGTGNRDTQVRVIFDKLTHNTQSGVFSPKQLMRR